MTNELTYDEKVVLLNSVDPKTVPLKAVEIEVTEEEISHGMPHKEARCAGALAITAKLRDGLLAQVVGGVVNVGTGNMFMARGFPPYTTKQPQALERLVIAQRFGAPTDPLPIKFVIDLPETFIA